MAEFTFEPGAPGSHNESRGTTGGASSTAELDLQWWTDFLTIVEGGNLTSDPSYYIDGRAQEGEFGNVVTVAFSRTVAGSSERQQLVGMLDNVGFWEEGVDLDYWTNTDGAQFGADLQNLANAANERLDPNVPGSVPRGGETGGASGDPESGLAGLTILQGTEMEWFRDPSTGKWYVKYGLPGSDKAIVFEVEQDQLDALFGEGAGPPGFTDTSFQALVGQQDNIFGGNVGQMEGEGSFEQEVQKVITLGLENGVLPEWAAQSGEVLDLLYVAQVEDKSNEWLISQIATTDSFKVRFPNIETLKSEGNLTWNQAVSGFLEFEAGVRAAVGGIGQDAGSVTPEIVGALLEKGHALTTVQTATTNFKRMEDYAPALAAFNEVLAANEMQPISTLQEMYEFVSGAAPSEVYDVWEASSLAEAASAAGLGNLFTAADAMQFAIESAGASSLAQSMNLFQSLSQTLLRFRNEIDLGEFDLNQEDILDIALGQPPRSGTSAAELQANMSRAVSRAQANLRTRGGLFKAFSPEGVPQAAGLSSLRPDA